MSDIVTVNISRVGQVISRQGFGTPLILGQHANFSENYKVYLSLEQVGADFLPSQDEYLAAEAIFNQNPSVEQLVIGKRTVDNSTITILEPPLANTVYGVNIDGIVCEVTSGPVPDALTISMALENAINISGADVVAASQGDGSIIVTPNNPPFSITPSPNGVGPISLTFPASSQTPSDALDIINNEFEDWYALALTNIDEADVLDAAQWTETNEKLFGTRTDNTDVLNINVTTDIASQLQTLGYERTFVIYSENAMTNFIECAWFGVQLTTDPGTTTWAYKSLFGITSDEISSPGITAAFSKNCNVYVNQYGKDVTRDGVVSKPGGYIDLTRGVDWLQARLTEDLAALIINLPKVPYTDGGISALEAIIRGRLNNSVDIGLLSDNPAPVVNVPRVSDIPPADRNIRKVSGITFNATLAGAIHTVEVQGFVI
jgi:hypothetical protein